MHLRLIELKTLSLLAIIVCVRAIVVDGQCTVGRCQMNDDMEQDREIQIETQEMLLGEVRLLRNRLMENDRNLEKHDNRLEAHDQHLTTQSEQNRAQHMDLMRILRTTVEQIKDVIAAQLAEQTSSLKSHFQTQIQELKNQFDTKVQDLRDEVQEMHKANNAQFTELNSTLMNQFDILREHDNCSEASDQYLETQKQQINIQLTELDATLKNQLDIQFQELENKVNVSTQDLKSVLDSHNQELRAQFKELKNRSEICGKQLRTKNQTQRPSDQNFKRIPEDCSDIRANGQDRSGVYTVYINSSLPTEVYCDLSANGESWLVFQRRLDGTVNFNRSWTDYSEGFGNANGEIWLGNELLYLLTSKRNYKLNVYLEDFYGNNRYAAYRTFSISSSSENYRLRVSGYSGNAGDSLSAHSGYDFSTYDNDHDIHSDTALNCALVHRGGWWYYNCYLSNLNGQYRRGYNTYTDLGIIWSSWRGYTYSLKKTEMKIARVM